MFRASTVVPSDLPRPTVVPSDPDGLRARFVSWRRWLNGPGQRTGLIVFFALVSAHMFEHIAQAVQVFVLGWPRSQSLGLVGLIWPWLIQSEWLHYGDVTATLVGICLFRPSFTGEAGRWWTAALVVSVWHLFEHSLLLGQALTGHDLFGASVPTSV